MKRQTTQISLALLLAAASQHMQASPLVSVGDNTDIFFNGSSNLQWSSNVFRNETNEEEDLMLSVTPGFEVNFGRGASNLDLSLISRYEIRRYLDLDVLDTELLNIQANGAYRTSRLDLSASAFFREQKSANGDFTGTIRDLVESELTGGRIDSEYRFSPKFSFGAGIDYMDTAYQSPYDQQLADRERYSIPLDLFYELTPKVDLSIGYAYTDTDVSATTVGAAAFTTEDHFFNVGARGNLLPKLTGFFKVGYRTRDIDRVGASSSDSTLGLDSNLTWAATPKLTNVIRLSRDFGVGSEGGTGNATENTTIGLSSRYAINTNYSASAFADYTMRDYSNTREDNQYRLGARLNYRLNEYWNFGTGYAYSENDSNQLNRSYTDHTLDISASLRY